MMKWIVGIALTAIAIWFVGPLTVPILVAVAVAWLLVKLANRFSFWRRMFDGRARSTQLVAALALIALVGVGGGVAGYLGLAQLSSDPCLSDWDISCSSPRAERLSTAQTVLLPVMFLGWAAFMAAVLLGAILGTGSLHGCSDPSTFFEGCGCTERPDPSKNINRPSAAQKGRFG